MESVTSGAYRRLLLQDVRRQVVAVMAAGDTVQSGNFTFTETSPGHRGGGCEVEWRQPRILH